MYNQVGKEASWLYILKSTHCDINLNVLYEWKWQVDSVKGLADLYPLEYLVLVQR